MKFQNPSIHRSKVSNFTEKWKNQSKIQNSVFLSKFDGKFSKINQVIYLSAPTSIPNMNALAEILFEISCIQDFQILFSEGNNSEKGHNSVKQKKKKKKKKKKNKKKKTGQLFFHEEYTHEISNPYHAPFKS